MPFRSILPFALAGVAFGVSLLAASAVSVRADDFGKRITLSVAPNYQMSTTGDAAGPNPAGYTVVGNTTDHPIPNTLQLDYGLDFRIDKRTHLYYAHSNLDYALGQVTTTAPKVALRFGLLADREDTIGLSHDFGHGLNGHVLYFDQERKDVTGLCLNQEACNGHSNLASIDSHGYAVGGAYAFGPRSRIGQIFIVNADAKYVPRSSTQPDATPNLGGLGKYTGSQFYFPYGITAKIPIVPTPTLIPTIGYQRIINLWHNEATPEYYNATILSLTKIINKSFDFNITNYNLSGCRCSDTVPPPDNIRLAQLIAKLEYKLPL